jgi:hypothetical protein
MNNFEAAVEAAKAAILAERRSGETPDLTNVCAIESAIMDMVNEVAEARINHEWIAGNRFGFRVHVNPKFRGLRDRVFPHVFQTRIEAAVAALKAIKPGENE